HPHRRTAARGGHRDGVRAHRPGAGPRSLHGRGPPAPRTPHNPPGRRTAGLSRTRSTKTYEKGRGSTEGARSTRRARAGAGGVPPVSDLVVRSRRPVTPEGERPLAVAVRDGRIAALHDYAAPLETGEDVDLRGLALLPGLVDTHVHVNEPGRTHWEGFATATRAAAAGGVTTIADMPLNALPPTTGAGALEAKLRAAAGQCHVDVAFWGGAVPGNLKELRPLHDRGVRGFKCFMSPSGVEEFPPLGLGEIRRVMTELAGFGGLLVVHAEDPALLAECAGPGYAAFLDSRPEAAERSAVEQIVRLARETGARAHILHVSAAG